ESWCSPTTRLRKCSVSRRPKRSSPRPPRSGSPLSSCSTRTGSHSRWSVCRVAARSRVSAARSRSSATASAPQAKSAGRPSEPRKEEILREMRDRYRPTVDSPQPAARALREETTVFYGDFTPESLRATTRDDHHFELIQALDPQAAIAVPLIARGHTVGAVTLAFAESRRTYEPADVELAEELARRAAFAVDNARLY